MIIICGSVGSSKTLLSKKMFKNHVILDECCSIGYKTTIDDVIGYDVLIVQDLRNLHTSIKEAVTMVITLQKVSLFPKLSLKWSFSYIRLNIFTDCFCKNLLSSSTITLKSLIGDNHA